MVFHFVMTLIFGFCQNPLYSTLISQKEADLSILVGNVFIYVKNEYLSDS